MRGPGIISTGFWQLEASCLCEGNERGNRDLTLLMHFMRRYFKREDAQEAGRLLRFTLLNLTHFFETSARIFAFFTSTATDSKRPRTTPTMHLAILFCLCISTASAVDHYGIMSSDHVHSMIEEQAQKLLGNDLRLVSLFTADNHHSHDGSDFISRQRSVPK